jgi:hypothetical protein
VFASFTEACNTWNDDQIKMTFTSTTRDFISTYLYPKPEQMLDEAASRGTARRPVRVK